MAGSVEASIAAAPECERNVDFGDAEHGYLVERPDGQPFAQLLQAGVVVARVEVRDLEVALRDGHARVQLERVRELRHRLRGHPLVEVEDAQVVARARVTGIDTAVHITIRKGIPVAGGMAGGSADAAAALVACDRLWELGMAREELEEIGADLGSDVPFLVAGGTAIGSGRGERLAPVLARGTFHWVFALAEGGLSTPTVFAEIDRLRAGRDIPEPSPTPELMGALRSGDPTQLALHLRNDLQEAAIALRPGLQEVIDDGLEFGALAGIVSGSGPTVAFLARDHETALDLAVALTASGAVRDVRRAHGPVHGAHVIPGPVD